MAGSSTLRLFVHAITTKASSVRVCIPSIWLKNSVFMPYTRLVILISRAHQSIDLVEKENTRLILAGKRACLQQLARLAIPLALKRGQAEVETKGRFASAAIAFASIVLPVPGAPCSSIPRGGRVRMSHVWKMCACCNGNNTCIFKSLFDRRQPTDLIQAFRDRIGCDHAFGNLLLVIAEPRSRRTETGKTHSILLDALVASETLPL